MSKDINSRNLSKIFLKDKEKYPRKRFEGFTEPWISKKLGSLLDYEQPTDYLVKSDSYDDSYSTPVLTAGKSFLLGYTDETEGIYKADNNNGVIIFDDFTTSSHFVDFDFKVKSSAMKFLRTNQSNFNLYFLFNLLTNINYSPENHERHWISIFSEFEVLVPTKREQEKIGQFFKKIDKMIQLQQSKVNKVKDIKSAYISEMFPKEGEKYPKKRFEGFTEPWEKRKLGLLLNYEQPTDYLVSSDAYDSSYTTPVLTAGKSFLLGYTNEEEGIYQASKDNGVIIFDDFTTSSHFVNFNFKVKSSAMKFLRTTQSGLNLYFLYNLLNNINYNPESHERHWISIFSEFEVLIPGEREQQKIANFFKNLDNQISNEEEKLEKLEKLKQAYLNDMFV